MNNKMFWILIGFILINNKMFWILIGFILILQIPLFLMTH